MDIRRITLTGQSWKQVSQLPVLHSNALEMSHRNRTLCYIHHNVTKTSFMCANIDKLTETWEIPATSSVINVELIQQMALDWVSENWYFLDDHQEAIIVCNNTLVWCEILIERDLSKPRAIALDPTNGFMFFTKWGYSPAMLERCKMDGTERKSIVTHKIVYPYGVTVDYPNQHVYWVDTYLDYVERVNYDGSNRKNVMKGVAVQNLYGISVFENHLFVSSWYNNSILEIHKFKQEKRTIIQNISRPFNLHIFHRQRQPDGKFSFNTFVTFKDAIKYFKMSKIVYNCKKLYQYI